jgi:uncharacterized protein (DUF305 family)
MIRTHSTRITTALIALTLGACAGAPQKTVGTSPQPDQSGHSTKPEPKAAAAGYPYTPADVEFMSHMIGHHAQAIVMSGWAPSHGASPSMRTLAERIINTQQDEIATMQRWLRKRGQPVPEARPVGMKMKMGGAEHEMLMPGMLTEAQMKQLDQARGEEFDRLFLTYMIQHHRGAVTMVNDLFSSRGAAQDETVFKFANDVSVDQSTEIARMERMLAALPSPGRAP